ncbi:nucleoside-diphosphate-sugar epimerase [Apodospora peruviana]|uniref:Nucleoside-diphosphate-sugar epimerase n=1 Tax=Apodospora peruviana TaxID=516989 RepID=A0AAE0LYD6_9PEZI|nr:nucleoside-diphosphate-sugar epimerase [Apodospora peruviana]
MHLILTGATGLIGSGVLDAMIKMKDVTKISILSRRPVPMADAAKDPRINVIIHKDFTKYDQELLDQLKDATGCVWALGISQSAVGKEEYIKITKDYALAAAQAFQTLPVQGPAQSPPSSPSSTKSPKHGPRPFHFVFVSGSGATFRPAFYSPIFARVKGETELALAEMRRQNPLFKVNTVRPAFVDPLDHKEILSYIPKSTPALGFGGGLLIRAVGRGVKSIHSPTEPLGRFLTKMAMGKFDTTFEKEGGKIKFERLEGGFTVVENGALRRMAGLD